MNKVSPPLRRFIEYGMYRGHYYGTSLESLAEVMAEGKVCLVNVHPSVSDRPSTTVKTQIEAKIV